MSNLEPGPEFKKYWQEKLKEMTQEEIKEFIRQNALRIQERDAKIRANKKKLVLDTFELFAAGIIGPASALEGLEGIEGIEPIEFVLENMTKELKEFLILTRSIWDKPEDNQGV